MHQITLSVIHKGGITIGFGQDEVGVGDRVSNSFSPRSESWNLKEVDVASTDLRTCSGGNGSPLDKIRFPKRENVWDIAPFRSLG